jgi:hypothetical protein
MSEQTQDAVQVVTLQGQDMPLARDADGRKPVATWQGEVPQVITGERMRYLAYNGLLGSLGRGQGAKPQPLSRYCDADRECSVDDVDAALAAIAALHGKSRLAVSVSRELRKVRGLLAKRDKAQEEAASAS